VKYNLVTSTQTKVGNHEALIIVNKYLYLIIYPFFLLARATPGIYSILLALGGPCHFHYFGQLNAKNPEEPCKIPLTMTMAPGQNIMVEYTSGHAAVFDQYTMHAGGTYTKDQCNIDIKDGQILRSKDGVVTCTRCTRCTFNNDSFLTNCKMCSASTILSSSEKNKNKWYNVRLHLEVDTSADPKSKTGSGFNVSSCYFMQSLISEFESRAVRRELFLDNELPGEIVLVKDFGSGNVDICNRDAGRISGGWLNDDLIEFIVKSSEYVMKNKNLQYVSTLFFAKLKEGPAEIKIVNGEEERVPTVLSGSKISFDMIDRWVKKKNYCYVEKDVVLFPINYLKSHWYLVTFIRPNLLFMRNADSEEQQPLRNAYSEEQQPFVLILDSLPTKNKTNYHDTVNALKEFFYICWLKRTKLNDTDLEATQLKRILLEEVPTVFPDCPLHFNFYSLVL
jgi:hypothetical protein